MSSLRTVNQTTTPSPPGTGEVRYFTTSEGAFIVDENGVVTALGLTGAGATVNVSTISDLPTPSGGIITLVADPTYKFLQSLDLGTVVLNAAGKVALIADSEVTVELKTTNASALISSTFTVAARRLTMVNDGGPVFACGGALTESYQVDHCRISGTAVSTFTGGLVLVIERGQWFRTGGIVSGAWFALITRTPVWRTLTSATATAFKMSSGMTLNFADIHGTTFFLEAGQTALDIDIGIVPALRGRVTNTYFIGATTPLKVGAVQPDTVGWTFKGCPGIEDSVAIGAIGFNGNATDTVIAGVDTLTEINTGATAWALDTLSERFVLNADGKSLEYVGVEDVRCLVHLNGTVEPAANNKVIDLVLVHDTGSGPVEVGCVQLDYRSTPVGDGRQKILSLSTGDLLELQVRNNTDATNVAVLSAEISVKV